MDDDRRGPLAGIRVLDLTRSFPGGYCTSLLADLGADVLKIEAPGTGDPLRQGLAEPDRAPAHGALNRAKRSMTLDLRRPGAPAVLGRLARGADVLIESARPGAMAELGFGYEQAAVVNPGLIWCAITGFGSDGPYADRPGHDLTFLGQSGLLGAMATQMPWSPDTMVSVPVGALAAAVGVCAALVGRARDGKGCFVDASISDAATWMLGGIPSRFSGVASRMGETAGRRVYRCGDGRYVTVAAAETRTWRALCDALGAPDLVDRLVAAPAEQEAMTRRFEALFATRPAADWVADLGRLGTTVGPVLEDADLLRDPHAVARGALVDVDGLHVPANPLRLRDVDGPRSTTRREPAPALGRDTESALRDAGFSAAEIAGLRASGTC